MGELDDLSFDMAKHGRERASGGHGQRAAMLLAAREAQPQRPAVAGKLGPDDFGPAIIERRMCEAEPLEGLTADIADQLGNRLGAATTRFVLRLWRRSF